MSGRARAVVLLTVLSAGCVSYRPRSVDEVPFRERAQTQRIGDLVVTVAVPEAAASRRVFGVDLWRRRIQPVWLRVENTGPDTWTLLKAGIDPSYYPAAEAARAAHFGTATRLTAYGLGTVLFVPLALPGAIDLWRARAANARMDEDCPTATCASTSTSRCPASVPTMPRATSPRGSLRPRPRP